MLQNIGTMAYQLQHPASPQVQLVFHVLCLKVIGDKLPVQTIFPELYEEGKIIFEPELVTEIKNLTTTKSINFRVSHKVEELMH